MANRQIKNWSQVNTAISKAGLNKNKSLIENMRKISYRHALEKQMQQHEKNAQTQRIFKQKEKKKMQKQVELQIKNLQDKKMGKVKTQQWYQIENLDLIKLNKESRIKDNTNEKFENNQFFKLQDRQRIRKLETRRNFQLQNLLNNKQIQIKNSSRSKQKELNVHDKEMYNSYVEDQFKKKQADRELWKNKYLFDKSIKEVSDAKNYGYAYQNYLRKQIQDKMDRKKKEKQKIDSRLVGLNQSVQNVTPSPAYVGLTQSFDRRRQINVIDRHMHFQPHKVYQKQVQHRQSETFQPNNFLTKIEGSLPQLRQHRQSMAFAQQQKAANDRYQQKKVQKKHKQYTSYDFISGTHKTFFM